MKIKMKIIQTSKVEKDKNKTKYKIEKLFYCGLHTYKVIM